MNHLLQKFARNYLKEGLVKLSVRQQHVFKAMYSHKNLDASINDIVDKMPFEKLDWAMTQVENSLEKNSIIGQDK